MTDDLKKCDCTIEVECEVIEQEPIEIELEVKQYFDGAGQKIKEVYFNLEDWVVDEETSGYKFAIYKETYKLIDFTISCIYLWDEKTENYHPALADYTINKMYDDSGKHIDTLITLYSDTLCKGKIVLFGQEINNVG